MREQSYGKQTLNVTVTPLLDSGQPCGGCPWDQLMGTAGSRLYQLLRLRLCFVVGPYDGSCGFLGVAFVGWPLALSNGQNRLSTYAHELGDTTSGYSMPCRSISGTSVAEYGTPYSSMGNQYGSHFNAWLRSRSSDGSPPDPDSNCLRLTPSNTYNLTALETPGGSTYAIKVAMNGQTYWIEDRGADRVRSTPCCRRVEQVRLAAPLAIPVYPAVRTIRKSLGLCRPRTRGADRGAYG